MSCLEQSYAYASKAKICFVAILRFSFGRFEVDMQTSRPPDVPYGVRALSGAGSAKSVSFDAASSVRALPSRGVSLWHSNRGVFVWIPIQHTHKHQTMKPSDVLVEKKLAKNDDDDARSPEKVAGLN